MLQVQQLVKHFGGIHAVDGVSFDVAPGECVALIGPNGAGKSTCFACIAGQYPLTGGRILWNGQALEKLAPAARLRQGVARTFQVAQVFEALTVLQNVQLAAQAPLGLRALSAFKRLDGQSREAAGALLAQTGLAPLAHEAVLSLSYGAKKRLELAVALAARPTLLLLDEPAAGLAEAERASLMALVRQLAGQGVAVLYTEHNMDAVAGVADRVLVLIEGRLAAQGSFNAIASDPTVRRLYLGESPESRSVPSQPESAPKSAESLAPIPAKTASVRQASPMLAVAQLNAFYGQAQALFEVSLQVSAGEMVVLQGLNGAGKSTLLKALMGLEVRAEGQIRCQTPGGMASIERWETHRRAQAGLGYVAEDRRLFTGLTVRENLHVAAGRDARAQEARVLDVFPLLKPLLSRPAAHLSGGQQQMLAIARTLMGGPKVLLLDEPCEGVSPVLVASIRDALLALKAEGLALLVVEQNRLLAASADRLLRLVAGKVRDS